MKKIKKYNILLIYNIVMVKKYSKQDQKILHEFLNNMYDHQQSLKGGSAFTEFLHGFLTPFKQFAGLIPGVSKLLQPIAESIDSMIPGHRYDTLSDVMSGTYIKGSGKRGRGRPRKLPNEIQIGVKIDDPMLHDKVFTKTAKQLIDDENKQMSKRPRGRPKKKV